MSNFQYTIQAEGRAQREEELNGADIQNTWAVFHKNPDDRGLWSTTTGGLLQITSNQNGLSGRYSAALLDATDYSFYIDAIPSGVDDDSFGIHFRYQDNFAFYFVAWDGGGEYNWGEDTLRLYKVEGDVYKLLASKKIGHWTGGQKYGFEITAVGNQFTITLDGEEMMVYTDNDKPYLYGAYGPCATSQVTTFTKLVHTVAQPFLITKSFDGAVTIENNDYESGNKLSNTVLLDMMEQARIDYLSQNGYDTSAAFNIYRISSTEDSVVVYFDPMNPVKETTNGYTYPYAYMKYETIPPAAPMTMTGEAGVESIVWSWTDVSSTEDGFEILDENDRLLAVLSANVTTWFEQDLIAGQLYTRKVRSYNQYGHSESVTASAVPISLAIVITPDPPQNLRGVTNSTTQITWYWNAVKGADSYELYDESGEFIVSTTSLRYQEQALTPDTGYTRYVVAKNIAGISGQSNLATAFTDALQAEGDVPTPALNFRGEALGTDSILWQWEAPAINISSYYEDGSQKTEEEIEAERQAILNTISYRVYDQNGEVLYDAPPGTLEFQEMNLTPDTAYTHFVRAFNQFGESERSNSFYVKTEVQSEDTGDEEEAQEPEWPIEKECVIEESEPAEKLKAFQSGIGDNLDLNVRVDKGGEVKEVFSYDLQLKGIEKLQLSVFDDYQFNFRFKAEGIEKMILMTGEYMAKVKLYPRKAYDYKVAGEVEMQADFAYQALMNGRISETIQNPIDFTYAPYANLVYHKTTNVTTASMFNDANTKGVYGPNTWEYFSDSDMVKGLQNADWSGAYNTEHLEMTDYEFECDLGVIVDGETDDDGIGVAFRIGLEDNGSPRMYYFMADRADSSGMSLGSVWRLGKTRAYASNAFAWPLKGTEVAATTKAGWVYNTWYHVKVQVAGTRIRIWVDNELVIDVVDDDPAFAKGAFGPTALSQVGASFKNFKVSTTTPEKVSGDIAADNITDVNNSSNHKLLNSVAVSSILNDKVNAAFAAFQSQSGNGAATLEIIDYGIDTNTLKVYGVTVADGTGGIYAYTNEKTTSIIYHPIVLKSPSYNDKISELQVDEASAKTLQQNMNGATSAYTAKQLMESTIASYKAQNNIAEERFFIDTYGAASLNPLTTVVTDTTGDGVLKAYTEEGTIYKGEKDYTGGVFEYQGWVENPELPSVIELVNKYGIKYIGASTAVTYTLTDNIHDPEINVGWSDTEIEGVRVGPLAHKVRSLKYLETDISGIISATGAKYFFVADLMTIPNTEEYNNGEIAIQKTGGHDNTYLYFRSDDTIRTTGEEIRSYRKDVIVIDAGERKVEKDWVGYTEWYEGHVNGNAPYSVDGDGKKDLIAPIEVLAPDSVELKTWFVETQDPEGHVTFTIQNGADGQTTVRDDLVTFSSDFQSNKEIELTWYGPRIIGETVHEITGGEVLDITQKVLSPYRDATLTGRTISEWMIIVLPKNPNVEIVALPLGEAWPIDTTFVDVKLRAQIANQTQASWSPLIHNGYYYFNQQEYFLYADSVVKGEITATDTFRTSEFPYTVKLLAEKEMPEEEKEWIDTNASDFLGSMNNVSRLLAPGDLLLTEGSMEGTYTSEKKQLPNIIRWGTIEWSADEPGNTKIELSVAGADAVFVPVQSGQVIPLPTGNVLQYKAEFTGDLEEKDRPDSSKMEYIQGQKTDYPFPSVLRDKATSINGYVELQDASDGVQGVWYGYVERFEHLRDFGTVTYRTDKPEYVDVYTVSSATPGSEASFNGTVEPWVPLANMRTNADGSITGDIASVLHEGLRILVVLRPYEVDYDATVTVRQKQQYVASYYANTILTVDENSLEEYASVKILDLDEIGSYVSPEYITDNLRAYENLNIDIQLPSRGGSARVYTISSDQPIVVSNNRLNELPWLEVIDGQVQSEPKKYFRIRIDLESGRTDAVRKETSVVDYKPYSVAYSNILADNILKLINAAQETGYIETNPFDFTYVESWKGLSFNKLVDKGTVRVRTQTAPESSGPWSAWQDLGANGEILSPVNSFIRYRVDLTAHQAVSEKTIAQKESSTKATATGGSIYTVTGEFLKLIGETGVVTSDKLNMSANHMKRAKKATFAVMDIGEESKVTLYTKTGKSQGTASTTDDVWSNWQQVGPNNEILSPDGDMIQYYMEVTAGFTGVIGSFMQADVSLASEIRLGGRPNENLVYTSNYSPVTLKADALTGSFTSLIYRTKGLPLEWAPISFTELSIPEGSRIRVFTTSFLNENAPPLPEDQWDEATFDEATQTWKMNSAFNATFRMKIVYERDSLDIASPSITRFTVGVPDGKLKLYKEATVSCPEIIYDAVDYTSPEVSGFKVAADVYDKVSPVLNGFSYGSTLYKYESPKVTLIERDSTVYDLIPYSPVLHDVTFSAFAPSRMEPVEYSVSLIGSVLADTEIHQVSVQTIKTIMDNYLAESNVSVKGMIKKGYEVICQIPGIELFVKDNNDPIYYENGESEIFGRTVEVATETIYTQEKVIMDIVQHQALITPIPQQGAPIIVKDATGLELSEVSFLDENGEYTLFNTEDWVADGKREFTLDYQNIDVETLEIWVDENATGVYTKVEDYIICNNVVTTKYTYAEGTSMRAKYALLHSFYVDYNYNVEENYALIKMHKPTLTDTGEITVRYETKLSSAYYDAEEVNLNPMKNVLNEGFLYIVDEVFPARKLDVNINPSALRATGYDRTTITVIAKDELGNPVVGDKIDFFASKGDMIVKQATTDESGMAIAIFVAGEEAGDVDITIIDRTHMLQWNGKIRVMDAKAKPSVSLELSKSTIRPDGEDKVKITARVVDETQQPSVYTSVRFSSVEGGILTGEDRTNFLGEAYGYLRASSIPADGILTIKIEVPSLEITEYINIRVNEVATIV